MFKVKLTKFDYTPWILTTQHDVGQAIDKPYPRLRLVEVQLEKYFPHKKPSSIPPL